MSQDTEAVVLLVEDDPDHAELVVRALAEPRGSVRLVHVPNGVSALEYLMREGSWSGPPQRAHARISFFSTSGSPG